MIELPRAIALYVIQEQFAALAAANRDLRLERTAQGELSQKSKGASAKGGFADSLTGVQK